MADIKELMRFWANYQDREFCSRVVTGDVDGPDEHPLAKAQRLAVDTQRTRERQPLPRNGSSRLALMGLAAGLVGKDGLPRSLPAHFVDHIACKESVVVVSRSATAAVTIGSPDEYRWIDRALAQLHRQNVLRAMVVRAEFMGGRKPAAKKAKEVAEQYGGKFTVWQYRKELALGLAFMEAHQP